MAQPRECFANILEGRSASAIRFAPIITLPQTDAASSGVMSLRQDRVITHKVRRFRRTKRAVAAGLVLTAALSTAACEGSAGNKPTPKGTHSTSAAPNPVDGKDAFYQQVTGPCEPTSLFPAAQQKRADAASCVASLSGNEAVVNFGLPQREITKITHYMRKYIREGSDGILDPHIRIVNASPKAERALANVPLSAKGCVNLDTHPLESPAFIAGYTMQQQLKKDAIVLAVSGQKPCNKTEAGVANTFNGRYADIFANRAGSYTNAKDKEKPLPPAVAYQVLGVDGAHETFHLHKQGHTGFYTGKQYDGFRLRTSRTFDLAKYLHKGNYDEYGEPSIMGDYSPVQLSANLSGGTTFIPNIPPEVYPWQRDIFNQSQEQLTGNKNLLLERTVRQKGLTITTHQAEQGRYGIAHLQEGVALTDTSTEVQYPFETIAFVPQVDQGVLYEVDVWLINFNNANYGVPLTTSVNIGTLLPSENKPMHLKYNNQRFTIGVTPKGVSIHSRVK